MMTLEEIGRLAVDLCIGDIAEDISCICLDTALCSKGIYVAMMYDKYATTFTSTDKRRLYMLGFIRMATEFRNHWAAVR